MDVISFSEAATANSRIEIINANPDSSSGIVTVPKTIASGETVTIPAGRVAILPNVQIDGVLNVEGEVFIPSGATLGDLDAQLALKADTSYVNAQLVLKQNVLVANDAGVKTALNATGTAPIYACRAWVNFNGTGTVAIRASGNVSSITDSGVGVYDVSLITAMSDTNYNVVGMSRPSIEANEGVQFYPSGNYTTTAIGIFCHRPGVGNFDSPIVNISVFR